jgi:succinoglycan biosynthesis transport protein ExoP
MNEAPLACSPGRSAAKAQFVARLHRYRDLLVRKWWVLVLGLAAGGAVEAALWLFQPPAFVSFGRMIVSIKLAIPEGSVYNEELSNFLGTQTALMQSAVVLNRARLRVAAQEPTLANQVQPVTLKVAVSPRTSIFVLEATGRAPNYVQLFLQACMEEYINLKKEMRAQTSDTTVAGLTEEVLRLEKDLRKGEEELAEFQKSNSVVLLQEQGNSAGNYLSALNQRLAAMKSEYDLLQTLTLDQNLERRQDLSATSPSSSSSSSVPLPEGEGRGEGNLPTPSSSFSSSAAPQDSDYLKAKQQLLLLKADQQDLAQFLRPKHPKMVALTEELARRERLLNIFRQQSAEQLDNRKASLARQLQNLQRDVQVWDARTLDISRKSADYQRLKANAQRVQALYDRLLATMQTLDVNKQVSPESVTIMEPASPGFPDQPKTTRRLLTAGFIAIALSIALLLFLDHLDDRINSFTELQDLFDESVLVQIPRQKPQNQRGQPSLVEKDDPRHSFVEAYRNLRSSLLYLAEGARRPRTLLLTSSIPNEGKSLTAANLAITLANSGARVLLVDADLRKGVLHNRFALQVGAGLCEVLAEGMPWETLVKPTRFPNLFLLPRGGATQQSSELFISSATATFLHQAEAAYDFVIVDTAPVMAADDVTSLAPHVNAVLFVLRAEHTSARVARAALELLYQRQVKVLGIVFNAVRPGSADYYYYYKYADYYKTYPSADGKRQGTAEVVES